MKGQDSKAGLRGRIGPVIWTLLGLFVSIPASGTTPNAKSPAIEAIPANAYRVAAIRAYLYYQDTQSFDKRDIIPGKLALRNVFIGEGDSVAPSGAILITIDVEGPTFAKAKKSLPTLAVIVRMDSDDLSVTRVPLGNFFSESGRISVPVIVYGTFCSDLSIVATIEGALGSHAKTAIAPFVCGE